MTNPGPTDSQATVSHSAQHSNANDAIEAIQAELGTDPSGASATVAARLGTLTVGPASAGDNDLVRFDGSTGKLVQDSSVSCDDSGNITTPGTVTSGGRVVVDDTTDATSPTTGSMQTDGGLGVVKDIYTSGNVTIAKASPSLAVDASSGSPVFSISAAASTVVGIYCRTAGVNRWLVGKNSDPESGSDAGSNFYIYRYSDAGAAVGAVVTWNRATGKTTLGSVGANAGVEYGTSGPRDMVGTGSPEGVVTAPVGSTWRDPNATNGAIRWIKASGTGNTGWKVEYGDTGWRNVTADLLNSWTAGTGWLYLRRIGDQVMVAFRNLDKTAATADTAYTLPTGFTSYMSSGAVGAGIDASNLAFVAVYLSGTTSLIVRRAQITGASAMASGQIMLTTAAAWPATLPGSAA